MSLKEDTLREWHALADDLAAQNDDVAHGRMMSAPALTHGGKVFAFHSTKSGFPGLGCRLGRNYPFETLNLSHWQHLAPFKTRPPMKDWLLIGLDDLGQWQPLAETALDLARKGTRT
ncbi:MAG: hypothetical protein AAF468_10915 [Pseudomonadota bacterium]